MTFTDKIPKDEGCGILEVTKSKSVAGADGRPVLYSESSCWLPVRRWPLLPPASTRQTQLCR